VEKQSCRPPPENGNEINCGFWEKMGKNPGLTPPKSWELHQQNLEFHFKAESFSHGTLLFYGVFNPSVP
jgi:hypothetical protein